MRNTWTHLMVSDTFYFIVDDIVFCPKDDKPYCPLTQSVIQVPLRTAFHDTQRLLLEVYISNVRSVFVFFAPLMKK